MHFSSGKISRRILVAPFVLVVVFAAANSALAQTETVLCSFGLQAGQGATPWDSLILDQKGNFYGTTEQGGANGLGTVFRLSPPATKRGVWTETVLYSFGSQSGDGVNPYDSLIVDKEGNLYGTTYSGGANNVGTVFELSPEKGGVWTETVLYRFGGTPNDGSLPYAGLIMDKKGNLYGTTTGGGAYSFGTVFKLSPKKGGVWTETVLYSFGSQSDDGVNPYGVLIMDKKGDLYGTTTGGGAYVYGEVFKLSPPAGESSVWTEKVLYSFGSYSIDGAYAFDGLIMDTVGNLYGTTAGGGKYSFGTVFQMSPPAGKGTAWTEKVLYSFGRQTSTGEEPWDSLIMDKEGNLYGTTTEGGATTHCDYGCGTVFKLSPEKGGM